RPSGRSAARLAHQSGGLGVVGSNPAAPTIFSSPHGGSHHASGSIGQPPVSASCRCGEQQNHNGDGKGRERMMEVRDSNGALLQDGDNVTVIKDLKVKGTSVTVK